MSIFLLLSSDIDECVNSAAICSSTASCANTAGNFTCTCIQGFTGDGVTCAGETAKAMIRIGRFMCRHLDINECADGSNDCSANATCTNTLGDYTCACDQGYSGDGTTCVG